MKLSLELTLGLLVISCVDAFVVPPRTLWAVSICKFDTTLASFDIWSVAYAYPCDRRNQLLFPARTERTPLDATQTFRV
jgi:hypothetical protein